MAQSARKAVVEPLSAARYRIQLNASAQLKQKIEHALDLLSHSNPTGDLAAVVERALDLLIERVEKERFAQTKSPRRKRNLDPEKRERSVTYAATSRTTRSAKSRSETALRCTFVGSDGQRCTATGFIQIHHEDPAARGGGESVGNLRMLCASHNRLAAERDFGRERVTQRITESRAEKRGD